MELGLLALPTLFRIITREREQQEPSLYRCQTFCICNQKTSTSCCHVPTHPGQGWGNRIFTLGKMKSYLWLSILLHGQIFFIGTGSLPYGGVWTIVQCPLPIDMHCLSVAYPRCTRWEVLPTNIHFYCCDQHLGISRLITGQWCYKCSADSLPV